MKRTRRTAILSLALCLALAGCAGPAAPAAPAASSGPAGAASAESAAPAGTRTSWQCDLLAGSTDYISIRGWAGCIP